VVIKGAVGTVVLGDLMGCSLVFMSMNLYSMYPIVDDVLLLKHRYRLIATMSLLTIAMLRSASGRDACFNSALNCIRVVYAALVTVNVNKNL